MTLTPPLNQLKKLISDTLGIEINQLQDNADFIADLNTDPLELKDLLNQIENNFSIKLENPDDITTFADLTKQFKQALDETL